MYKRYFYSITLLLIILGFFNVHTAFSQTGSELFLENRCANCHTIGRGRFVGPDLYDISKKYNKQQVKAWIINPDIVYSQTNKKPYNPGYPPMPRIGVTEHDADLITNFLFSNDIKKQKENMGVIDGKLINETTGKGVEGSDIYLKSFIGDRQTDEKLAITDSDGKFSFKNLSWVNSYAVMIKNEGLEYETAKMVFPPDKGKIDLKLPLFETTEDSSEIVLNLNHEIVSVDEKAVSIAEIYDFQNRGKEIYIGQENDNNQRVVLKFYVPSNAINLRFIEGIDEENITRDDNFINDSAGFPPGRKRVVIGYEIPLEPGKNEIKKEVLKDVNTLLLLVDDKKDSVQVSTLTELEPVTIENSSYKRWSGSNLNAGSSYVIIVKNSILPSDYTDLYPIVIFAVLFLSVFIIGLISRSEVSSGNKISQLSGKRDKIIQKIIELDGEYERKEIEESVYQDIRKRQINKISEIDKIIGKIKYHPNGTG